MNKPLATRFVVVCAPRTGSTMLRLLLNSHSNICAHGEVFGYPLIRGFVGLRQGENSPMLSLLQQIREEDPVRYLRDYVFLDVPCTTVGAKTLYATLENPRWKAVLDFIKRDPEIRIVHLFRENRLKRYLSQYIVAEVTKVKVVFQGDDRPLIPKVEVRPEQCLQDMESTEADEHRFREVFRDHRVFEVTYEQILNSGSGCLDKLQCFLNVVPESLKLMTQKLVSDDLREVIANYDEVERGLRGTRHHRYFD